MWQIKAFKTAKSKDLFIKKHKNRYEMEEILLNNAYGVEYRELRKL